MATYSTLLLQILLKTKKHRFVQNDTDSTGLKGGVITLWY